MKNTLATILPLIAAAGLVAVDCCLPAGAEAQQGRSLDDELLEDLGADPVDEFDRELFGGGKQQGRPGEPPDDADDELQRRLRRELGRAAEAEDEHPVLTIARLMRDVQQRIAGTDSGPETRKLQKQILSDFDELLKQARKARRQSKPAGGQPQQLSSRRPVGQPRQQAGNGGRKPSERPATASSRRPTGNGRARPPDMQQMRQVLKQLWGELPQREREQMLQLPVEEFLPKYEQLIEEYFRRLSEEKQR